MPSVPEVDRPYLPMIAAVEANVLDLGAVDSHSLTEPLGVTLAQGRIPSAEKAGLFDTSRGLIACDHVHIVRADSKEIVITPSSKNDVAKHTGDIYHEGELVLTSPEGWLKLFARAIDRNQSPWQQVSQRVSLDVGPIAIQHLGMRSSEYTITEVESETGIIIARAKSATTR